MALLFLALFGSLRWVSILAGTSKVGVHFGRCPFWQQGPDRRCPVEPGGRNKADRREPSAWRAQPGAAARHRSHRLATYPSRMSDCGTARVSPDAARQSSPVPRVADVVPASDQRDCCSRPVERPAHDSVTRRTGQAAHAERLIRRAIKGATVSFVSV